MTYVQFAQVLHTFSRVPPFIVRVLYAFSGEFLLSRCSILHFSNFIAESHHLLLPFFIYVTHILLQQHSSPIMITVIIWERITPCSVIMGGVAPKRMLCW